MKTQGRVSLNDTREEILARRLDESLEQAPIKTLEETPRRSDDLSHIVRGLDCSFVRVFFHLQKLLFATPLPPNAGGTKSGAQGASGDSRSLRGQPEAVREGGDTQTGGRSASRRITERQTDRLVRRSPSSSAFVWRSKSAWRCVSVWRP